MSSKTQRLTISALLVALGIIFSRFLSIPISLFGTYSMNIGLGMLPILLLCVLYGPIYGALGAACWDLLGALLFPKGAFVVWFTLAAAAFGFVTGMFFASPESKNYLKRSASIGRTFLAVLCGQFLYSACLNTLIIHVLYSVPVMTLLIPRLVENCIMIFVNTALILVVLKALSGAFIVTDKLPRDIKLMNRPQAPSYVYTVHEQLCMVGGHLCNHNVKKAREMFELVMLEYRKNPSEFTANEKRDLMVYRAEIAKAEACQPIVVEEAFDIDAELEKLKCSVGTPAEQAQRARILDYYDKNQSMFTPEQAERMKSLAN